MVKKPEKFSKNGIRKNRIPYEFDLILEVIVRISFMSLILTLVLVFGFGCAPEPALPQKPDAQPEPIEEKDEPKEDEQQQEREEIALPERVDYDFSVYPIPEPFRRGINMGNALEAPVEGAWGMVIREEFFQIIKEAGFDHVRIPVRWSAHASAEYPYNIWPGFLRRVDEVVHQALSQGLTAVINIHHYEELMHDPKSERERFLSIWRQIAEAYKDWPPNLYFSILNEPMGNLTAELWNEYLVDALNVIRQSNSDRMVVIGPANWNAVSHLAFLDWPEGDKNLMATFHYYSPFEFTHQGAGWVTNPPPIGTRWTGTEAEIRAIQRDLDRAARFSEENDVMVWLGEFGAYSTADMESRVLWTATVAREAEKRGIPWSYWEFGSGFGAYDRVANQWRQELLYALVSKAVTPVGEVDETPVKKIFDFDADTGGWIGGEAQPQWGEGNTKAEHESENTYEGDGSLRIVLTGGANRYKVMAHETIFAKVEPGKTFVFRFFVPEDSGVTAIQPFAQYNNWAGWADSYIPDVPEGVWITIDWTIPEGVSQPLNSFGIMVHTGHTDEKYILVDNIEID